MKENQRSICVSQSDKWIDCINS